MSYIQLYLSKIQSSLASGHATEHTYRPALEELFKLLTGYSVHNEPKRSEHGAPDFVFLDGMIPMMYAEAKDIHISLDKIEKSEQLDRYFGYPKLILTNGIEFRFYKSGLRYSEPIVIAKKEGNLLNFFPDRFQTLEIEMRAFQNDYVDNIRSAFHLAKIMGGNAQRIRNNLREMMKHIENYTDIERLYNAFQKEILHDLTHEAFADLYAQTLVYGLFVARYHDKTPETFSRTEARELIPKSTPLLQHFFDHIAGINYQPRLGYVVDELCKIFSFTNVEALMHGIYQKNTHDPVIHFYEDFLGEYDSELRMARGVFYTPAPVVKFIIRAVDDILRTHFNLPKGLLDSSKIPHKRLIKQDKKGKDIYETTEVHRVQILDPATGTGTFLDEIIRHIHSKLQGQAGMWPSYVNQDLLPRLHGFELMMASYTIAHLKLGLTLAETGIDDLERRLQIYLTNSLEEATSDREAQMNIFGLSEAITNEGIYADEVKRDKPVMIVVGNPPYSVSSTNKSPWIEELMKDYKKNLNERNIQPLSDDYIKFIRFGESLIEKNGEGILAYISNNSFIDGIIHRQMRQHLRETFDSIYIVNLHGDSRKKEKAPDGSKDENVFDIMQGVSINIFVKMKASTKKGVYHYDLYGKRQEKYDFLEKMNIEDIEWNNLSKETHGFFTIKNQEGKEEYDTGFFIHDFFVNQSIGIVTGKDDELVVFNPDIVKATSFAYRPFDTRYTLYDGKILQRARTKTMNHLFGKKNIALVLAYPAKNSSPNCLITTNIVCKHYISGETYTFPLYLYSDSETIDGTTKTPNLDVKIWGKINEKVGKETTPEEVLDYIYAILHSPKYREKYKEFLKIDFPRVPYPTSRESFEALVKLGGELRGLHLLESPKVGEYITTFPIAGTNEVEKVSYEDGQVFINSNQYFGAVPEVAWSFYIGGYQPAQKWLKDRKGRILTWEDIAHYQSMIVALTETARVMGEVDRVLEV